ncbi:MAG: DUF2853 family protein [Hyphomicrobiales bacterium]
MADYYADVKNYDSGATEGVVKKIVNHLGIALRNRDSSLVSCSDDTELSRVREKWLKKKLGETDDAVCDKVIAKVCETMKPSKSNKSRVTFYYLCAKEVGKLSMFE